VPEVPKLVSAFVSRRIIPKPIHAPGDWSGSWSVYLLNPAVANWAVATAQGSRDYLASLPRSQGLRLALAGRASLSGDRSHGAA
jgi:hypothetical protein